MKYYIADAFTNGAFTGNPAGVCLLDEWLPDEVMQNIAAENNLSETAFLVKNAPCYYNLRWFTPMNEVDLCGHATLASAFIVLNHVEVCGESVQFSTVSGMLNVAKNGDMYTLDFPSRMPVPVELSEEVRQSVFRAIGMDYLEAHGSRDLVLLLPTESDVRNLAPDMRLLSLIPGYMGVCVTAKGESVDFVSRFFVPKEGIPEDPVTGSTHCNLIPFWARKLNKREMTALQLSKRGGKLSVKDNGERVEMSGYGRLYLDGEIFIE